MRQSISLKKQKLKPNLVEYFFEKKIQKLKT